MISSYYSSLYPVINNMSIWLTTAGVGAVLYAAQRYFSSQPSPSRGEINRDIVLLEDISKKRIVQIAREKGIISADKNAIQMSRHLFREGMTWKDLDCIASAIEKIAPEKRKVFIEQAKQIGKEKMRGKEIGNLLQILGWIQKNEEREIIVQQVQQLIKPEMRGKEILDLVQAVMSIPLRKMSKVMSVITPDMDGNDIRQLVRELSQLSSKDLEALISQFRRFDTRDKRGFEKKEILLALVRTPPDLVQAIADQTLSQISEWEDIPSFIQNVRVERILQELSKGLRPADQEEMTSELSQLVPSSSFERVLYTALPLISEHMSVQTRLSIVEWVSWRYLHLNSHSFQPAPDLRATRGALPFAPNDPLRDLPRDLRWRLYIDREEQERGKGPNCFDQQFSEGYRESMDRSLELIDQICDLRMNHSLLELLHDVCVGGVSSEGKLLKKGYCEGWQYGFDQASIKSHSQWNRENWEEKLLFTPVLESVLRSNPHHLSEKEIEQVKQQFLARATLPDREGHVLVSSQFQPGDEWRIDAIFDRFYEEAVTAQTMDQKYAAVSRCCRALSVFHAFPDGNGRTICFSLLPLLLHQIGSPPSIQKEGGYPFNGTKTAQEMVVSIKEGVEYFQRKKVEVLIGEYAGVTPIHEDASRYEYLNIFYNHLKIR